MRLRRFDSYEGLNRSAKLSEEEGYDEVAKGNIWNNDIVRKGGQRQLMKSRLMKHEMSRTSQKSMDKDTRSAMKRYYYRLERKAQGLSAG